jgi:hypothetical protein
LAFLGGCVLNGGLEILRELVIHTHTYIYTHTVYTYNMVVMVIVGLMVEIYPGVTKKYADDMLAYYSCNVVTG